MHRLLSCLLAFAVLVVGVSLLQSRVDPVGTAEAQTRASCPTKALRAQYARCFIDRGRPGRANFFSGSGAKEYYSGGGGDDRIVARGGADRIIGGPGRDKISAGDGNNVISVRDGEVDTVLCGRGRSRIVDRDANDIISPSCYR